MGRIKKILENELLGGAQSTDIYPVTSTKAVYDTENTSLDTILGYSCKTLNKGNYITVIDDNLNINVVRGSELASCSNFLKLYIGVEFTLYNIVKYTNDGYTDIPAILFFDESFNYINSIKSSEPTLKVSPSRVPSNAVFFIIQSDGTNIPYAVPSSGELSLIDTGISILTTSQVGKISTDINKLENTFSGLWNIPIILGYYIHKTTGEAAPLSTSAVTDYQSISGVKTITYTGVYGINACMVAFYDANKNFISSMGSSSQLTEVSNNRIILFPPGAAYFRASFMGYNPSTHSVITNLAIDKQSINIYTLKIELDNIIKEIENAIISTDRIANGAITKDKLSADIQSLISNLSKNSLFAGIATPTTNPGTPNGPVFYIATEAGIYANFSNLVIDVGQLGILNWNGTWSKQVLEIGAGGGNKILEWNTDVATTRKSVPTKERKAGMQISYLSPTDGWINEQYVSTSFTDEEWVKDTNWDKILNQAQFDKLQKETESTLANLKDKYSLLKESGSVDFAVSDKNGATALYIKDGKCNFIIGENVENSIKSIIKNELVEVYTNINKLGKVSDYLKETDRKDFAVVDDNGNIGFSTNKIQIDNTSDIMIMLGGGQSLSVGSADQTHTVSGEDIVENGLMLDMGINVATYVGGGTTLREFTAKSFTGLKGGWYSIDGSKKCETPYVGLVSASVYYAKKYGTYMGFDYLAISTGVGAQPISSLSSPSDFYKRCIESIIKARDIAISKGKTIRCPAVFWTQGENDSETDPFTWKSETKSYLGTLASQIMATTKQNIKPIIISYQPSQWNRRTETKYTFDNLYKIANEYTALAIENILTIATPIYIFDFYDAVHLTALCAKLHGIHYGRVFHKKYFMKHDTYVGCPIPKTFKVFENSITITYIAEKYPLLLDDNENALVKKVSNYGFEVIDNNNDDIIQSVTAQYDKIIIECSKSPIGCSLRYATFIGSNQNPRENFGVGRVDGVRGNLRDSLEELYPLDYYNEMGSKEHIDYIIKNYAVTFIKQLN